MTRIAIDADVLGRQRTGDETYVAALLRELVSLVDREELFAITRRPDLVPAGVEAVELAARSQIVRMTLSLPRAAAAAAARPDALPLCDPAGIPRPCGRHHSRSVVRAAPRRDGLPRPAALSHAGPAVGAAGRAGADRLGADEARPDRALRRCRGANRRHAVRRRSFYGPDGPRRDGHYALFVGAIQPRKDPVAAIEALALLNGDLRLVLVGPEKSGGQDVRDAIKRLGVGDRVELAGHVERDELAALYRGAACLVFPSRYEGFGLPIVEAMASGTPVVAARAGAVPEVAGDAAVLVEPGDPVALAGGIERALADRERLVAAGFERARRYSWVEAARQTLDVYRELT